MTEDTKMAASTVTLVSQMTVISSNPPRNKRLTQYIAALSATLGAFALGNVLAWTSPTALPITGGDLGFPVTPSQFAWVGSVLTLGAAASTLPTGFFVDFIGRKNTMLFISIPFAVGWALIVWADNVDMLYAGRVITGFCGGLFSVASPLYIGEISEKEIRGTLGTSFQLMVVIGIEFVYVVGTYVSVFTISLISMLVPIIFAAIFFWMPETPQFHLKKGRQAQAHQALQWFRGGAETQHDVAGELQEMKQALEASVPVPLLQTFKSRAAQRAMVISVGLMIFQQLSGINAVIFYTPTIFQLSGSSIVPAVASMIVGMVQVLSTVLAAAVIDKVGRRSLMLVSFGVMAVCQLLIGVFMYLVEQDKNIEAVGWIPLVLVCLYFVAFSLGAGPIPWLMLGEIFPSEIKGTASSLSALINWLIAFLVTKFYGDLNEAINGSSTFWIFTGCLVVGSVFVFFVQPETRGKTLEEIQQMLGGSANVARAPPPHTDSEKNGGKF